MKEIEESKQLISTLEPEPPLTDVEVRLIQEYEDRVAEFRRTHRPFSVSDVTDELVKQFIIFHRGSVRFKFAATNYDTEVDQVLARLKNGECRNADGGVYSYDKAKEELVGDLKYRGR